MRAPKAQAMANAGSNYLARRAHPTGRPSRTADCAPDGTAGRSRIAPALDAQRRLRDRGTSEPRLSHRARVRLRAPTPSPSASPRWSLSVNHCLRNRAPKIPRHTRSSFGPGASPASGCFHSSLRPWLAWLQTCWLQTCCLRSFLQRCSLQTDRLPRHWLGLHSR